MVVLRNLILHGWSASPFNMWPRFSSVMSRIDDDDDHKDIVPSQKINK